MGLRTRAAPVRHSAEMTTLLPDSSDVAPRAAAPQLDQRVEIETPEQVVITHTVAGVGSRGAAALIDFAIIGVALLLLVLAFELGVFPVMRHVGAGSLIDRVVGPWLTAMMVFLSATVFWLYYVVFESLADGQTPGKRALGLRVVQDGGYSISFGASAARNIVRLLDLQPFPTYAIGIVSMLVSRGGKRLGDLVAGTIVVHEKRVELAERPAAFPALGARLSAGAGSAGATAPAPRAPGSEAAQPRALPSETILTADEYALLDRFMARRQALDAGRRAALAAQLIARFRARLPDDATHAPETLLSQLFTREREARAHGAAARGDTGAARERYALVARSTARWAALARIVERAQHAGGIRGMTETQAAEFVARYREASADLARLRTASRGEDSDALYSLSRLVAAGHNLLYRRREVAGRAALRYVLRDCPREIRRSWRQVALAALLLFGPAAASYIAVVRHPAVAPELLPAGMIDRAENAVRRGRTGGDYVRVAAGERPAMASWIIANNVQVTYLAFAAGISAGIGTVLALVTNGVSIGAGVGLYRSKGIARVILAFVAAHGVLELSAICLGGGAGFLLAQAILLPGALTRREALVVQGRRALRLVAAATLFLACAGSLEGLVSPDPMVPDDVKFLVAGLTGVAILCYASLGRLTTETADAEENAYSDARALISR